MKAAIHRRYGPPEVLTVEEIGRRPEPSRSMRCRTATWVRQQLTHRLQRLERKIAVREQGGLVAPLDDTLRSGPAT